MKTLIVFSGLFLFILLPIVIFSYRHIFTLKRILTATVIIVGLPLSYVGYYYIKSIFFREPESTIGQIAKPETCPEGFATFPEKEKITHFDNIILDVSCGHRWGRCPNYSLAIEGNGNVSFDGKEDTQHKGVANTSLSGQQIASLVDAFNKASFFSIPKKWGANPGCCLICGAFDGNYREVTVTVTVGDKTHSVYYKVPSKIPNQLTGLESAIQRTVNVEQWIIGTDEERRNNLQKQNEKNKNIEPFDPKTALPDPIPSP